MSERFFSTYQVADLLGATPGMVVEWMEKGWLPFERLPDGPVRVSEDGLIQFLRSQGIDIEQIMSKAAAAEPSQPASAEVEPARPERPEAPPTGGEAYQAELVEDDAPPAAEAEPDAAEAVEPVAAAEAEPADPAAQVAEAMLRHAVSRSAGEIHLEPVRDGLALRMRIDGLLHERASFRQRLPEGVAPKLIAYLKALAGLDIGQCSRPQSGEFITPVDGRQVELAIATCPTPRGEKLFIRILDRRVRPLSELGLSDQEEARLRAALAGGGLVVLAAPPRCGKDETLRAMLAALAGAQSNCLAIEADAEAELEWVTHCRVGQTAGLGFPEAVRAAARQRPEAVMVADLRNPPTALAALEAALGGSVVLAGMHSPTAAGAVETLLEMGLEPWPLSSVLAGVIEHQTIRLLCASCKQQVEPSADELEALGLAGEQAPAAVFAPGGCSRCGELGYAGRAAVIAPMPLDRAVVSAIRRGADAVVIEQLVRQAGGRSLLEAAVEKARAGLTSLAELRRVFGR